MSAVVAGLCLAVACWLAASSGSRRLAVAPGRGWADVGADVGAGTEGVSTGTPGPRAAGVQRFRGVAVVGALAAGSSFVPWPLGILAGMGGAALVWTLLARAEPPELRRRREQAARGLADVVQLLGVALASGTPLSGAVQLVARARPGPAADAVAAAELRLSLGLAWDAGGLGVTDPGFTRLGRALTRSVRSGAPVADTVARLSKELAVQRRLEVADRARTVGVRAAVPLGLCLLPAFLLLGIVPVVVASLQTLPW